MKKPVPIKPVPIKPVPIIPGQAPIPVLFSLDRA